MQETVEKGKLRVVFDVRKLVADPSDVVLMAQQLRTCLETKDGKACGGDLALANDDTRELVCKRCGRVWGSEPEQERIPFTDSDVESGHSESSYQPGTHLEFGNGLGSQLDRLGFSNVLRGRKNLNEETFVASRTRFARVPMCHPLIKDFLSFGSDFCKKHDLHQRHNMSHARFADQLGINLRLVGEHYVRGVSRLWADPWRVSAALFCLLFRESYPEKFGRLVAEENGRDKYPELCLPSEVLTYFGLVLQSCSPPVLPQLP